MKLETTYELRTLFKGKIARRIFVSSPPELYAEFKAINPSTKVYIFKNIKDEDGNIVQSNKLDCKIHRNSFIVKTLYEKTKRIPKDSKRGDIRVTPEIQIEQIYDIALLETPLLTKRVLPITPATRRIPERAQAHSQILKSETLLRQADVTVDPILRTVTKVTQDTYRGVGTPGASDSIRKPTTAAGGTASRKTSASAVDQDYRASASSRDTAERSRVKTISRVPENNLRTDSSSRTGKSSRRS